MSQRTPSHVEKFYLQYEHMANAYAGTIFNYERHGYERQDIVQELKIKIYNSIIAYAKKWAEYRETGRYKPVPIKFYIQSALVNRTKDFIKEFNNDTVESADKLSIESDSFDYSIYTDIDSTIDLDKCICQINGVDLFEGIENDMERRCFALYIKGYTITKLKVIFKNHFNAEPLIQNQIKSLRGRQGELFQFSTTKHTIFAFEEA